MFIFNTLPHGCTQLLEWCVKKHGDAMQRFMALGRPGPGWTYLYAADAWKYLYNAGTQSRRELGRSTRACDLPSGA